MLHLKFRSSILKPWGMFHFHSCFGKMYTFLQQSSSCLNLSCEIRKRNLMVNVEIGSMRILNLKCNLMFSWVDFVRYHTFQGEFLKHLTQRKSLSFEIRVMAKYNNMFIEIKVPICSSYLHFSIQILCYFLLN